MPTTTHHLTVQGRPYLIEGYGPDVKDVRAWALTSDIFEEDDSRSVVTSLMTVEEIEAEADHLEHLAILHRVAAKLIRAS